MSLKKRQENEIKNLRWIEMRKQKRQSEARKEKNQSRTSVRDKAKAKSDKSANDRERTK